MKKLLAMGVLALAVMAISYQPANAWGVNLKFGIGVNLYFNASGSGPCAGGGYGGCNGCGYGGGDYHGGGDYAGSYPQYGYAPMSYGPSYAGDYAPNYQPMAGYYSYPAGSYYQAGLGR